MQVECSALDGLEGRGSCKGEGSGAFWGEFGWVGGGRGLDECAPSEAVAVACAMCSLEHGKGSHAVGVGGAHAVCGWQLSKA
jgi:hypothetical protein